MALWGPPPDPVVLLEKKKKVEFSFVFSEFDIKRDPTNTKKKSGNPHGDKPNPRYIFNLIKALFSRNKHESWPQLECVVATFISRASEE